MNYEQKYKEALDLMKDCVPDENGLVHVRPEDIFSELAESEDEKIKKGLIENFKWFCGDFPETTKWGKYDNLLVKDIIAWLEKQGEQKPVPKFNIGDTMRTLQEAKDGWTDGMPFVVSIDSEYYNCNSEKIAIKDQDEYEYPPMNRKYDVCDSCVEQKPAWSEEDENVLEDIKEAVVNTWGGDTQDLILDWLKSLKQKHTWKPTDGQMEALEEACDKSWEPDGLDPLYTLYEDLKKLKEVKDE